MQISAESAWVINMLYTTIYNVLYPCWNQEFPHIISEDDICKLVSLLLFPMATAEDAGWNVFDGFVHEWILLHGAEWINRFYLVKLFCEACIKAF